MVENPAAFPKPASGCEVEGWEPSNEGMSLRDYFAGQTLAGIATSFGFQGAPWQEMARDAYIMADAMLKARLINNGE